MKNKMLFFPCMYHLWNNFWNTDKRTGSVHLPFPPSRKEWEALNKMVAFCEDYKLP